MIVPILNRVVRRRVRAGGHHGAETSARSLRTIRVKPLIDSQGNDGQRPSRANATRTAHRLRRPRPIAVLFLMFGMGCSTNQVFAQLANPAPSGTRPVEIRRMVTQGLAKTVNENLFKCDVPLGNYRNSAIGTITADDGTVITVPAQTAYQTGPKLTDMFNQCNGITPAKFSDVKLENVRVVEIDPDGEVITGYIVADNYFELYVNGKLVGVDRVPFTPFNSAIVRFKARKPYTYALKAVDWEERLGLGMETNRGNHWHAGDGGLIARFSDGTVTDHSWRAQSFYIAPLAKPGDVVERGDIHDTSTLGRVYPAAKLPACQERCFAVHYPVPENWMAPDFDDARWPRAFEFTNQDVGVDHIPAYTRFPEAFAGARWIWSYNLVFDNLVLVRKTVR